MRPIRSTGKTQFIFTAVTGKIVRLIDLLRVSSTFVFFLLVGSRGVWVFLTHNKLLQIGVGSLQGILPTPSKEPLLADREERCSP